LVFSENTIKEDYSKTNLAYFSSRVYENGCQILWSYFGKENGIAIQEVTKQAFIQLGDNGVIKCAQNHSCSECTHKYKETADRITGDDPAAVLGVDENHQVPALVGEDAELAIQDAA
jgi:hypothetical protein